MFKNQWINSYLSFEFGIKRTDTSLPFTSTGWGPWVRWPGRRLVRWWWSRTRLGGRQSGPECRWFWTSTAGCWPLPSAVPRPTSLRGTLSCSWSCHRGCGRRTQRSLLAGRCRTPPARGQNVKGRRTDRPSLSAHLVKVLEDGREASARGTPVGREVEQDEGLLAQGILGRDLGSVGTDQGVSTQKIHFWQKKTNQGLSVSKAMTKMENLLQLKFPDGANYHFLHFWSWSHRATVDTLLLHRRARLRQRLLERVGRRQRRGRGHATACARDDVIALVHHTQQLAGSFHTYFQTILQSASWLIDRGFLNQEAY